MFRQTFFIKIFKCFLEDEINKEDLLYQNIAEFLI